MSKMKLAIIGLLVVGQVLAAPERHRRDTSPTFGGWEVPNTEFTGEFGGGFGGSFAAPGEFGFGSPPLPHVEFGTTKEEFGSSDLSVQHDEYGVPHEEYGPPPVPHEEYGPPPTLRAEPVTEHYCPEEDIVPPFAPAPAPPAELPLPVIPEFRIEYTTPPQIPHQDYGPPHEEYGPPHEEYGIPATVPPPPVIYYAPYPAVTTTTEVPTTTEAIPPPPPIYYAPYPAPTTTTEVPTTTEAIPPPPPIYYAPYPAPTTTTEVPTTVFVRIAPYPAPTTPAPFVPETKQVYPGKVHSKYETDSGLSGAGGSSSGNFGDEVVIPEVPSVIPAVRAPHAKRFSFIKPKIVFSKKFVSLPKISFSKRKFIKFFK